METLSLGMVCVIVAVPLILPFFPEGSKRLVDFFNDPSAAVKNYLVGEHWRLAWFLAAYCLGAPTVVGLLLGLWYRTVEDAKRMVFAVKKNEGSSAANGPKPTRWVRFQLWLGRPDYTGSWDQLIRTAKPTIIEAHSAEGPVVCGYFGQDSFVRVRAESEELFLECEVVPRTDGLGWTAVVGSKGVWVERDKVQLLRLF
jgi:hypothetical protein